MSVRALTTAVVVSLLLGGAVHAEDSGSATAEATPAARKQRSRLDKQIWCEGEPDDGAAPLKVDFNCELLAADKSTKGIRFVWDFADESKPAEGVKVTHTFKQPGKYTVRAIATDKIGGRAEDLVTVTVSE